MFADWIFDKKTFLAKRKNAKKRGLPMIEWTKGRVVQGIMVTLSPLLWHVTAG